MWLGMSKKFVLTGIRG